MGSLSTIRCDSESSSNDSTRFMLNEIKQIIEIYKKELNDKDVIKVTELINKNDFPRNFDEIITTSYEVSTSGGLNEQDIQLLNKYFKKAERLIEWGMGASTLLASNIGVKSVISLDGDMNWVNEMRNKVNKNVYLQWLNIGLTKTWSHPKDNKFKRYWPLYSSYPLHYDHGIIDVYFIDGRFRLSCALISVIDILKKKSKHRSLIMIHDFSTRIDMYGEILRYTEVVDGCCSGAKYGNEYGKTHNRKDGPRVVVLKLLDDIDVNDVWMSWDENKYNSF